MLIRRFTVLITLAVSSLSTFAVSSNPVANGKISSLVQNGTVILNDESGNRLVAINPDVLYIPASIIKVLTAQIALDLLDSSYRFTTGCYRNVSGTVTLRGHGDPFLVSDELRLLARACKKHRITSISKLNLDFSYFSDDLSIPGISQTSNPYDALNGSLVVNFNTVNIGKDAAGNVVSAEKETPLTPIAREKGCSLAPGATLRLNLSAHPADCRRYAAELLETILTEQGISISDSTAGFAPAGPEDSLIFTYENSRTLGEVLTGLLKYSNNFIANQIFLTIGAEKNGQPATMEKSRKIFESYIRSTLGIPESQLVMVEGSGISRSNQVTGAVMIAIMEKFKVHASLLTPKNGHPVKSGTLNGVNNYAGYIKTAKGLRSFVIMLNQPAANRDKIMKLLESY